MLNIQQLKDLVGQVAEQMEHPTPIVVINNRFKTRTLARASWNKTEEKIEFNKCVLDFDIDELIDLIRHEMFHIKLRAGDDDFQFQIACRLSGVKLNGDENYKSAPTADPFKYQLVCTACGTLHKKYRRLAGYAKRVKERPQDYFCKECGNQGRLSLIELKGGN
ncbi:MAG: hypothetical protein WCS33_00190 [Candidatus Caldatribacteriota bacterium]